MAVIFAILYFSKSLHFLVAVLIIHRLSNILHFIIDLIDEKRTRDLSLIPEKEKNDEDEFKE
jgi:hypothetical protein